MDFLGGPVVKNPPAMQGTWIQSIAWEDFTCCGQLSPCDAATKPIHQEPVVYNRKSRCSEKLMYRKESSPHSQQLEKAHTKQ